MTEEQARAAGYTVEVTNAGVHALFPDHVVMNGTNVPISGTNMTVTPIKKTNAQMQLGTALGAKAGYAGQFPLRISV